MFADFLQINLFLKINALIQYLRNSAECFESKINNFRQFLWQKMLQILTPVPDSSNRPQERLEKVAEFKEILSSPPPLTQVGLTFFR
jgi:hypothetical protein